ncbi:MAG: hypothetical protein WBI07_11640, partial [Mobilitalea sp.]
CTIMLDLLTDKKYNHDMRRCNMARTGRPKSDNPLDRKVSIRFTEEEYEILLEYAANHEMSITQAIKMSVKLNILSAQK